MIQVVHVVDASGERQVGRFEKCAGGCGERFAAHQVALVVLTDGGNAVVHEHCVMAAFSQLRQQTVDPRFDSYRRKVARQVAKAN